MSGPAHPSGAVVPFSFEGWRGDVLPSVEGALHTKLMPSPMQRALEGRVLRVSNTRRTARVAWDGVGPVLLKVHRTRSLGERALSLLRRSRARAEWDAARFLDAVGCPVPEPLAVGETRRLGLLDASFYAARFLEGLRPVHDVLPEQPEAQRAHLLDRLALLIRGVHDRGFDHRDLHSGNVLLGPGPGDRCRIVVADLHRCRWGGELSDAERRRGVAQWLHSLREEVGPAGRSRWLAHYLAGAPAPVHGRWLGLVEARMERFERVRRKSRAKRCFKESTVYTRDVGPGWGARRRDLAPDRLEAALRGHDEALRADDERVLKRGRRGLVTRTDGVVVKERRPDGPLDAVRARLWARRHAAGYRNAHTLGVHGVGTARPLAHVRRDGRSFTLYEDLSHLERLDAVARTVYTRGSRAEQVRLREAVAVWLGRLHAEGIYHGDLKGVNVLVAREAGGHAFHLIDTDRCHFGGWVSYRRRAKNLAQLAASIPVCVTRTERLRWFGAYQAQLPRPARHAPRGAPPGWHARSMGRDVARHLAEKIVVVDEPIE